MNIKVEEHSGYIRIRFQYNKNSYSFNPVPRARYSDINALAKAQDVAKQIEWDIKTGNFDTTLAKYKPSAYKGRTLADAQRDLEEAKLIQAQREAVNAVNLATLFDEFTEFKKKTLKRNSLIDYNRISNKLKKCPYKLAKEAPKVLSWLVQDCKGDSMSSVNKHWKIINACCNWAVACGKLQSNPFNGLKVLMPTVKNAPQDDLQINPFTSEERDQIIEAFYKNRYYSYYAPMVKFIFLTGCRPEEAIALQWKHIRGKQILFCQKVAYDGTIEAGTKTQEKRTITVNTQLENMLNGLRPNPSNPEEFVFRAKMGGIIDWHNFTNRAWAGVLESLPHIEYRNPYQMRHTCITLMVRAGVDGLILSKWVGNSPDTIAKHYLGNVGDLAMPDI